VGKGDEGDGVVRVEAGCAEGGPEAVWRRRCGVDAVVAAEGLLWAWLVSVLYSCTYSRICMHLKKLRLAHRAVADDGPCLAIVHGPVERGEERG
jgi:hypothetical protein